jgi:hypothetical protein
MLSQLMKDAIQQIKAKQGGADSPSYTYDPTTQTYQQVGGRGMKTGGKVSSASKRADGCAVRGKTKGKIV